jgi:hypothetical protein
MTLVMKSADYHRSTQQLPFMLESALSLCKSKYINWENKTKLKTAMFHEDYIKECHPSSSPVPYHSMFPLHPWLVLWTDITSASFTTKAFHREKCYEIHTVERFIINRLYHLQ